MDPILTLRNVSLNFGGLHAVKKASFDVPKGQITSLIGPNGAGKTTIFNIICGILKPFEGEITFDKENIVRGHPHHISNRGIGRTFQAPRTFGTMTVLENVMVGLRQKGENPLAALFRGKAMMNDWNEARQRSEAMLEDVGLLSRAYEPSHKLSFGEQRFLSIARTMVSKPSLILMDEPTVGLDTTNLELLSRMIKRIVENHASTILLIEHNMEMVMSLSDRVTLMVHGTVVTSGQPSEVRSHKMMSEAYLGVSHVA